jgi:chromosome segregation ATPase
MNDKEIPIESGSLLERLKQGMKNVNESISNIEGEWGSEEMGYIKLYDSSDKKVVQFSKEIERLKEGIGQLQGGLKEANFKLLLEQAFSSQLHKDITGLESQLLNLKEEEKEKTSQIKELNTNLESINGVIIQKESEIENLDLNIKEK